ncbi:unnamed protein product [Calypogeia fissa]
MGSTGAVNIDGTQGSYDNFFKNVKTSCVVPARVNGHPEKLNPSHLDHLHMDRYVPVLFCYQLADTADATYRSFVDRVKSSLAEALVAFYPLAGRVLKTTDLDHPRLLLFDDAGVPFTETVLDSEMGPFLNMEKDFRPVAYLSGFEPAGLDGFRQIQAYHQEGNPAFFVQVTRFKCGGVILALSWNHIVADMTGAVSFFTAWSEISRVGSTSIVPDHDRSILSTQYSSETVSSNGTPSTAPSVAAAEAAKIQQVLRAKYTVRTLHIRKEAMDKVVLQAKRENPEVSRMDCVSAHLWRSLAKIYAQSGISDSTVFTTAVEGRSKMGVSPHYFGNTVTSASVNGVPAADILSKPVSYAASLIRKAIKGITSETYWTIINEMDLRNPWKTSINRTDYQMGLTSWVRFGLNDIDFGFGNPVYVGVNLPAQNCRKGQTIVLPSALGEGSYSVMIFQFPHILEALFADPEFTSVG